MKSTDQVVQERADKIVMQKSSNFQRGSNQEWQDGEVNDLTVTRRVRVDPVPEEDQWPML
jgi:hypothetical protein